MATVIIDYGSGNLRSAAKAFERAANQRTRTAVVVSDDPAVVRAADRVVLPGVGAFAACYQGLMAVPGLLAALHDVVHERQRPFLGICVGMQLLAEQGHEHVISAGLGWIKGHVTRLTPSDPALKIPHMGWNALHFDRPHPLLAGIEAGEDAYFVHSYHMHVADPADRLAIADYGGPVTAMVARGNVAGVQFHPEKSQGLGLRLIENFLEWMP